MTQDQLDNLFIPFGYTKGTSSTIYIAQYHHDSYPSIYMEEYDKGGFEEWGWSESVSARQLIKAINADQFAYDDVINL